MTAIVVAWALVACGFTVVTLARLGRRPTPASPPEPLPAVLLVRPGDALRAHELRTLARPIPWPAPLEHVVLAPRRPPLPPGVRWIRSDPGSPNRKVGHLLRALATEPHADRVVCAVDADVAVDPALLAGLVGPLQRGAALVTAAPEPLPGRGLAALAVRALLVHTHQSFVALDAVRVGPKAICGKAMALGSPALAALEELQDRVGEDLELSRWLHARGERVELAPSRAALPQEDGVSLREALDRFTRWMQVLRGHRPGLFPTVPLLFTPAVPLALLAIVAGSPSVVAAVAGLWSLRSLLARRLDPRGWWAWPLGEALLAVAFARASWRRTVVWRGRVFRLGPGGRMRALAA